MAVRLGRKEVGGDNPVYFIAEIGINHCGQVDLAKQLIQMAKDAGADCVKLQKRVVEDSFTKAKLDEKYETRNSYGPTYGAHKHVMELSHDEYKGLKEFANELGLDFIATPCDIASVDFLDSLNVPFFKVASGDLRNRPLIEHIASKGIPMIISTGNSDLETIRATYSFLIEICPQLVMFACTSSYPAQPQDIDINVIKTYEKEFPKAVIGYSGHELGSVITLGAVAVGAKVVERHITLDRTMRGSDHACSLEAKELKDLISGIRTLEIVLGPGKKYVRDCERKFSDKLTKSLVATHDLKKGHVIVRSDLIMKHPGTGVSPMRTDEALGKKLKRDILADTVIFDEDVQRD
jgi:sialic acid synthase SpsE